MSDGSALDPERVDTARHRCMEAQEIMLHHEAEAATQRARILTLCRTWQLDPDEFGVEEPSRWTVDD